MTDIAPERSRVLAALEAVKDPKTGRGLVSAGLVQALVVQPGRAGFMMEVEDGEGPLYAPVRDLAEQALVSVPGVDRAQVVLTADKPPTGARITCRTLRLSLCSSAICWAARNRNAGPPTSGAGRPRS